MWETLEWSLDVATAVSIIGAAAAFLIQTASQKKTERKEAIWSLLRELANGMATTKDKIVQEYLDYHINYYHKLKEVSQEEQERAQEEQERAQEEQERAQEEQFKKRLDKLEESVYGLLVNYYYYAKYDFPLQAKALAKHYGDEALEKSLDEAAKKFCEEMEGKKGKEGKEGKKGKKGKEGVLSRFEKMKIMKKNNLIPTSLEYYESYLLREMGMYFPGMEEDFYRCLKTVSNPDGLFPHPAAEKVFQELGYTPRHYIEKDKQPPTAFKVLDKFLGSVLDAAK